MDSANTPQHPGPGAAAAGLAATRFLVGRKALVTGAAGGIGRACAEGFAAAGAEVYVVGRAAEGAEEAAGAIGGTAVVAGLSVAEAADALPDDAGIVVNNAGLQHIAPVHEFPPERFALMQRVMVRRRSASCAVPCPICTRGRGVGWSTSPRCTGCGPAPTNRRTSRRSTRWRG